MLWRWLFGQRCIWATFLNKTIKFLSFSKHFMVCLHGKLNDLQYFIHFSTPKTVMCNLHAMPNNFNGHFLFSVYPKIKESLFLIYPSYCNFKWGMISEGTICSYHLYCIHQLLTYEDTKKLWTMCFDVESA